MVYVDHNNLKQASLWLEKVHGALAIVLPLAKNCCSSAIQPYHIGMFVLGSQ